MKENMKLKNAFQLRSRLTVYVPSTMDVNVQIDTSAYVDKTAELMSKCFGGSSSTPALGYWVSDTMGLVKEKTTLVFSNCNDSDLDEKLDLVIEWCEIMKKELNQEAIALELNGIMYFI